MTKPAVFLDRDGTLIEERGYLDRMELLELFPWTPDALRLLKRAGYTLVVVTNQSAIARGVIDEAFLDQVHRELSPGWPRRRDDRSLLLLSAPGRRASGAVSSDVPLPKARSWNDRAGVPGAGTRSGTVVHGR
jgi:hypothetical protein